MSTPAPTLREDLEAAIEQFEQDTPSEPSESPSQDASPDQETSADEKPPEQASEQSEAPSEPEPERDSAPETPSERRRDAKGRFLPDEAHPDDESRYPNLTVERVDAPPEGWRPAAREGWSELPESIRREIHRREQDIATGLQESADARDLAERFTSLVTPFSSIMAAEGASDPLTAVKGLLETAAALRMGSAEQKAERIARLISHYGVDVAVLDSALAASIKGEPSAASAPVDPALDARIRPIEQFMQDISGRLQQADQTRAQSADYDIEAFERDAEFISDVRLVMADLLETAANHNRAMSLQEAYDLACQMDPEIKAVLDRRAKQSATETLADRAASKRELADSTLHAPRPGAPGAAGPQSNGSLRGDLERAIAMHEQD